MSVHLFHVLSASTDKNKVTIYDTKFTSLTSGLKEDEEFVTLSANKLKTNKKLGHVTTANKEEDDSKISSR